MGIIRRTALKKELDIVFGIVLAVLFVSLCIISENTFAEAYINLTASGDVNIEAVKGANPSLSVGKSVVSVDTNAAYGYSLYISAPSEETNGFSPLTLTSDNSVKLLGLNSTTPVAFSSSGDYANMWGFAVPGDNAAGYEALVGSGGTIDTATISSLTWQGMKNDDQKIYDSSDDTNVSLPIYYGVFINDTASSGTYTNVVSYTAVVESPPVITDGMSMQQITQSTCENTPTGVMYDVIDDRDGKHYFITHYNNDVGGEYEINECWMVQNLDLDLVVKNTNTDTVAAAGAGIDGGEGIIMGTIDANGDFAALTTINTDLPADKANASGEWQILSGSKGYTTQTSTGTAWNNVSTNGGNNSTYEVRSYAGEDKCWTMNDDSSTPWSNTDTSDICPSPAVSANTKHEGNMYNFSAAMAGTILNTDTISDAPGSICPKGWRVPYGMKNNIVRSYYRLLNSFNYNGNTVNFPGDDSSSSVGPRDFWNAARWSIIKSDPPTGFAEVRSGFYDHNSGDILQQGIRGHSWSSNSIGKYLYFHTFVFPGTAAVWKGEGMQLRCVLR